MVEEVWYEEEETFQDEEDEQEREKKEDDKDKDKDKDKEESTEDYKDYEAEDYGKYVEEPDEDADI